MSRRSTASASLPPATAARDGVQRNRVEDGDGARLLPVWMIPDEQRVGLRRRRQRRSDRQGVDVEQRRRSDSSTVRMLPYCQIWRGSGTGSSDRASECCRRRGRRGTRREEDATALGLHEVLRAIRVAERSGAGQANLAGVLVLLDRDREDVGVAGQNAVREILADACGVRRADEHAADVRTARVGDEQRIGIVRDERDPRAASRPGRRSRAKPFAVAELCQTSSRLNAVFERKTLPRAASTAMSPMMPCRAAARTSDRRRRWVESIERRSDVAFRGTCGRSALRSPSDPPDRRRTP